MNNLRRYGNAPLNVAVIHGGPGAAGGMAPVARELASGWGILEPLQTATSLEGQVEEVKVVLEKNGDHPVILIGWSWGAWLSYIVAAYYPSLVKKLILIGSGPFEEKYVAGLRETRLNRLSEKERIEFISILEILSDPSVKDKSTSFARLGALCSKTDSYNPIECGMNESDMVNCDGDIFQSVWKDAVELRRSGKLLELGKDIKCSVVAIHGDYDPHPAEGIQKPLSAILKSFRFILLKNCGHMPWVEREAREEFFRILKQETRQV